MTTSTDPTPEQVAVGVHLARRHHRGRVRRRPAPSAPPPVVRVRPPDTDARPTPWTELLAAAVGAGLLSTSTVTAWWAARHGAVARWNWVHQMDDPDRREPLDLFAAAVGHGILAAYGTVVAIGLLVAAAMLTIRHRRRAALWCGASALLAAALPLGPAVTRVVAGLPSATGFDLIRVGVVAPAAALLICAACRRRFRAWCEGVGTAVAQ